MNKIVIHPNETNGVSITFPVPEYLKDHTIEDVAKKDIPQGTPYRIIDESELPKDPTFVGAWEYGNPVTVNLDKAKQTAHEIRRAARAMEFAPYDEIIMKQIPGPDLATAEEERQKIRDKYAEIQNNIDLARTVDRLSDIVRPLVQLMS